MLVILTQRFFRDKIETKSYNLYLIADIKFDTLILNFSQQNYNCFGNIIFLKDLSKNSFF